MLISRADRSLFGRWWWTVDRSTLLLAFILIGFGYWLTFTASPAVAVRIGVAPNFFILRHSVFLLLAVPTMLAVSLLPERWIRRGAIIAFLPLVLLTLVPVFIGDETKGAMRWISIGSFSLQPSEFLKPCFIVVCAWLLCADLQGERLYMKWVTAGLMAVVAAILLAQPDVGQTFLLGAVWAAQMAIAGLPVTMLALVALGGLAGLAVLYLTWGYVASRINVFFDLSKGESFQVKKSLSAFESGGMFGRGPGEGVVKLSLPDAHTDYIFAVAGEELGAFAAIVILLLFLVLVVKGLLQLFDEDNPFRLLAVSGLLIQFGLQAFINMGVALAVLPPKGMTLPLVSYGGSSMLALCASLGVVLALSRRARLVSGAACQTLLAERAA